MARPPDVIETIDQLPTPSLVVDRARFEANLDAAGAVLPGDRLRAHVKAFKSTAIAAELARRGHRNFCAATPREIEGMVAAGLTDDLLLANESLDVARLGALTDEASITVAVDSEAILDAAVAGGIDRVLIDVNVGLPRCGCSPDEAPELADLARARGLTVRGVMGYEGHLMMIEDRAERTEKVEESMAVLAAVAAEVGGDIISAGGTGTFDVNTVATEIQAGSFVLMDSDYARLDGPFRPALSVLATVISVNPKGWVVADAGIKAIAMDHGNPLWDGGDVLFCSDEHATLVPQDPGLWKVGDRVRLTPAHVDPTVARHESLWLIDGDRVVDHWPVDLRGW